MARHARHEMQAAQAAALESARAAALAAPGAIDPEAVLALLRLGHAPTLDNVYAMMRRRGDRERGSGRRLGHPPETGLRRRRSRRLHAAGCPRRRRRSAALRSKSASASTNAEARYLGWLRRSSDPGRPRPHASAAARNAIATASSRSCAIASSVRCSTATLLRIVHPFRPDIVGGSSCSPGDRTDHVFELAFEPFASPCSDPGRRAPSRPLERSTSTKIGSASGATNEGQLISGLGTARRDARPRPARRAPRRGLPRNRRHSPLRTNRRPGSRRPPLSPSPLYSSQRRDRTRTS